MSEVEWNAESLILTSNKSTFKAEMAKKKENWSIWWTFGVKNPLWANDILTILGRVLRHPWGMSLCEISRLYRHALLNSIPLSVIWKYLAEPVFCGFSNWESAILVLGVPFTYSVVAVDLAVPTVLILSP